MRYIYIMYIYSMLYDITHRLYVCIDTYTCIWGMGLDGNDVSGSVAKESKGEKLAKHIIATVVIYLGYHIAFTLWM